MITRLIDLVHDIRSALKNIVLFGIVSSICIASLVSSSETAKAQRMLDSTWHEYISDSLEYTVWEDSREVDYSETRGVKNKELYRLLKEGLDENGCLGTIMDFDDVDGLNCELCVILGTCVKYYYDGEIAQGEVVFGASPDLYRSKNGHMRIQGGEVIDLIEFAPRKYLINGNSYSNLFMRKNTLYVFSYDLDRVFELFPGLSYCGYYDEIASDTLYVEDIGEDAKKELIIRLMDHRNRYVSLVSCAFEYSFDSESTIKYTSLMNTFYMIAYLTVMLSMLGNIFANIVKNKKRYVVSKTFGYTLPDFFLRISGFALSYMIIPVIGSCIILGITSHLAVGDYLAVVISSVLGCIMVSAIAFNTLKAELR